MANGSRIGRIIVVTSAALAGVVALKDLGAAYLWRADPDPDPQYKVVTDEAAVSGGSHSEQSPSRANSSDLVPTTEKLSNTDPLAEQLAMKIPLALQAAGCGDASISLISAGLKVTDPNKTESGFKGAFLEGSVTLTADQQTERFTLVGSGKGPFAEDRAVEMAIRNLVETLRLQDSTVAFCEKG